jgi:hypothetical protein
MESTTLVIETDKSLILETTIVMELTTFLIETGKYLARKMWHLWGLLTINSGP